MKDRFYITTAIDYPNGSPHMGHAYEKIVTDFYARYHSLMGKDVYFLTGTDENGQKLKTSANKQSMDTKKFVDQNVEVFKDLCQKLNITNNDFIRTTEQRHHKAVHDIWIKLLKKDLIYLGQYTDYYCDDCENFYTENQLDEEKKCPHHHKELPKKTEEGYFFKLSAFQDWLVSLIEAKKDFILPSGSRNHILSRLKNDELRDLSISRPNEGWGVPVPGDEKFVIYTWFDALINYYSGLDESKKEYWPANCHVIGTDIIWFHCVIWPSILNAAELEIPKHVYVHGMVLAEDGKKMSKSLGNGVDPLELLEKFDLDTFRFYILRSLPSFSNSRFSEAGLIGNHNNSLANDYGNLIMRAVKMTLKKVGNTINYEESFKLDFKFDQFYSDFNDLVEKFEHDKALNLLWSEMQKINQYINEKEPWKHKEVNNELKNILFNCLYAIHSLSYLLYPVMPSTVKKVFDVLGMRLDRNPLKDIENLKYELSVPEILFLKIEDK